MQSTGNSTEKKKQLVKVKSEPILKNTMKNKKVTLPPLLKREYFSETRKQLPPSNDGLECSDTVASLGRFNVGNMKLIPMPQMREAS